jgi:uncharacterized protein involved in exopolysaccharide biosynthesis
MEPTSRFTSPAEYWMLVREKKSLILVPAVVALVIGVAVAYVLPKKYTSSASFFLKDRATITQLYKGAVVASQFDSGIATLTEEMKSFANLSEIAKQVQGLTAIASPESPGWEPLIQEIRANLQVSIATRRSADTTISLTFSWPDARQCYQFVNLAVASYQDKTVAAYRDSIKQKRDLLKGSQSEIETAIANSTTRIREFDDEHLQDIGFDVNQLIRRRREDERSLAAVSLELETYSAALVRVEADLKKTTPLEKVTSQGPNPRYLQLREEVAKLEQQVREYKQKYTEKHKNLVTATELLERTKVQFEGEKPLAFENEKIQPSQAYERLSAEKRDLETKVAVAKGRKETLQREIRITNDNIQALPDLQRQKSALLDEKARFESQLAGVVTQARDVDTYWEVAKDIGGTLFETLEVARMPLSHSSPQRPLIIAIGLGLGLGLGLLLVFASEFTRKSFATLGEARERLPIPIVGAIGVLEGEDVLQARRKRRIIAALAAAIIIFMGGTLFIVAWAKPDLLPGFLRETLASVKQLPG